jgi:hypothetical protein
MNYSEILQKLEQATLFDIYRLRSAMDVLLEQPEKLLAIKRQLHVGMSISYLDKQSNKLVAAVIAEIRRNSVGVRHQTDGQQWIIPLYLINLNNVDTRIHRQDRAILDRNQLQVGESIGFLGHNDKETYGVITQLNPKTVSIITRDGKRWRVAYSYLFKILDTSSQAMSQQPMIDVTPT